MTTSIDFLVSSQYVITCEEENQVLKDHALAVAKGKIIDILPKEEAKKKYPETPIQSYDHHVLMPGFINSHTHLAMNIFRGLADDLDLLDWLNNYIWPAETKWVSNEFVYDATKLALAEMIRSGSICYNDMYFFPEATAKATIEAGLRGFIGMTVIDVPTQFAKTTDEYFDKALSFYDAYKNDPLITPTWAPHSTYTVSVANLEKVARYAKEQQLRINTHLQEAPEEMRNSYDLYQKRPLERLVEIGMVSPQLIAIHMTQINEADEKMLQEYRPNIVHCPESNLKLVCGVSPVDKLLKLGINVALGTDGAVSNNDLNMFGEMKMATLLSKLATSDPTSLPVETVLQMATLHGAKALGISDVTGSLAVNKSADFIAVKLDEIETMPLYHPISQLVYSAARQQVTDVWVKGKQLMKNRALLTLDEAEIKAKAHEWRSRIGGIAKAGLY